MLVASCTLVPCRLVLHHMVFFFFLTKFIVFSKKKNSRGFFLGKLGFFLVCNWLVFVTFWKKNATFSISKFRKKKAPIVTSFKLGAFNFFFSVAKFQKNLVFLKNCLISLLGSLACSQKWEWHLVFFYFDILVIAKFG